MLGSLSRNAGGICRGKPSCSQRLFESLKTYLLGEKGSEGYAAAAQELGMSAGAYKVAVHRVRRRYRELLRDEIGKTVANPGDVDAEIQELFAVLGE